MLLRKLVIPFVLLFSACAQVVTPDGGPKDIAPPRVVEYAPDSAATNFKGKKIVIRFNEYIALNDLNKQLIISPAVKRRPEVTIRKKELVIEFKDSLEANTTYSISFGKSIRDITENNVLNNFQYVFSTGPVIDSLTCSGQVQGARTLRQEKGVLVMLYRNTSDSAPYKEKPYYYTRTDDQGNFRLTNLAPATYKIFVLEDEGEDYLYNSSAERIAFSDSLIKLNSSIDSLRFLLFQEKPSSQSLLRSAQIAPGHVQFAYNLSIAEPSVEFIPKLSSTMEPFIEYNEGRDTINIWFKKVELDSVRFVVKSGTAALDTIEMALTKPTGKKPVRQGAIDPRALVFSTNTSGGKLLPGNQFCITLSNPIQSFDQQKVLMKCGADTISAKIEISENKHVIKFTNPFPEDSSFSIFIPPAAIIDWFGQKSDTIQAGFTVSPARQFGNLSIKFPALTDGKYVVEVVDEKDRIVKDTVISGKAECRFSVLAAGNYRIRIISDTDGNKKWTSGSYPEKKQAERVRYYSTSVRIRAGWDMDVEWGIQ